MMSYMTSRNKMTQTLLHCIIICYLVFKMQIKLTFLNGHIKKRHLNIFLNKNSDTRLARGNPTMGTCRKIKQMFTDETRYRWSWSTSEGRRADFPNCMNHHLQNTWQYYCLHAYHIQIFMHWGSTQTLH